MKAIHANKLGAVMEMKFKALLSKNFIVMPLFAIGYTIVMKLVYGTMAGNEGHELTDDIKAYALGFGALMNVSMTGLSCVSASLAEEKEKHTLRVLMTSSVNGLEFFFGSLLPVVLMITGVNAVLVPLAGMSMTAAEWGVYMTVSLLSAVTSSVLGMIFGIFAKNQVSSGTITMPALMLLMLVPIFSSFSDTLDKISDFLFTGVLQSTVFNIAAGEKEMIGGINIAVMIAEIVAAVVCFLVIYKRNGYDKE